MCRDASWCLEHFVHRATLISQTNGEKINWSSRHICVLRRAVFYPTLLPRKRISVPGAALRADGYGSSTVGGREGERLASTTDLAVEVKLKL